MKKIGAGWLLVCVFASSNLLVVADRDGNILHTKKLKPTENAFIRQKATEYSLQAIYDELHRAENLARMAQAAKARAERIAREKKEAEESGKTFHLSKADKQQLLEDAKYYKGGRYVWGGTTPQGFDCSGYVQYLYKKHRIDLPRTAYAQSKKGQPVAIDNLQKGDLLFFLTDKKRGIPVTHVGIYIGEGKFIHAASKKEGIVISPITHGNYREKFVSARRVLTQA